MEILSKSLRSYIFRRRVSGKSCPCGIHIPWSKLRNNKGLPQCFLHTLPNEIWRFSPLHKRLPLPEFRNELLAKRTFYGIYLQELLTIAFSQSQGHVLTVFRLFKEFLNLPPGRGSFHLATQQYYRSLSLGWRTAADCLRNWKTVRWPHQGYTVPILQQLRSLACPLIREEFRRPEYALVLRTFAAETFLTPLQSTCDLRRFQWRLSKVYRGGFAQTVQNYHWRLLGFWTVTVRAKIAHWSLAHTFKPLPPFTPNTEALALLVQRNPHCVPQAYQEFLRALSTSDTPLLIRDMPTWMRTFKSSPVFLEIAKLYERTQAWRELGEFFADIPQYTMTPQLLMQILQAFENAPRSVCRHYEEPLRYYLQAVDFPVGPQAACAMLSACHPLCKQPPTFQWLLHTTNISRYIRNECVAKTLVDLYMNRAMCIRLSQTYIHDYVAYIFWQTAAVQNMYTGIQAEATTVLRRFIARYTANLHTQKERQVQVLEAAANHVHAWNTVAIRWRYISRPKTGECPVCFETSFLITLHGERRHRVCSGCRPRVIASGRCPLCRASLATCSLSEVSSISHASDNAHDYYEDEDVEYEEDVEYDEDYDDDQWYHYD